MRIILCAGNQGKAVLIGDVKADPVPGEPVELQNARMVIFWSADCGGLLGLAAKGPKGDSRITHTADRIVEAKWQEWVTVSDEASEKIDKWPAC